MRRQLRPLVQTLSALEQLSENAHADSSSDIFGSDTSGSDTSRSDASASSADSARGIFYLGDGDPEDVAPARDGMFALARDLKQNLRMFEVADPNLAARLGQPIDTPWFAVLNASVAATQGALIDGAALSRSLVVFDLRQNHTIHSLRQWALVQMLPLLVRSCAGLSTCKHVFASCVFQRSEPIYYAPMPSHSCLFHSVFSRTKSTRSPSR